MNMDELIKYRMEIYNDIKKLTVDTHHFVYEAIAKKIEKLIEIEEELMYGPTGIDGYPDDKYPDDPIRQT